MEIAGEFGAEDHGFVERTLPVGAQHGLRRMEREVRPERINPRQKSRIARRRNTSGLRRERRADQIDAPDIAGERQREGARFEIGVGEARARLVGVQLGDAPVDQNLAALLSAVQETFQAVSEPDLPFGRGVAELVDQRREGGIAGFHREIPPHQSPVLVAAGFVVGGQHEKEIARDAERLHRDHHLGQVFGDQQLLLGRVGFEAGNIAAGASGPLHVGAVLGEPDRTVGDIMAFQVVAHAVERLGKFADGAVGMDIEDIEVFARAVFHDHIGVGQQRRKRVAADCNRQLRIGGLETEGGGFQRRRVIPGGFEGKADVLLVPELPDGHLTPEMFRFWANR